MRECGSGFGARRRLMLAAAFVPLLLVGCGATGCEDEVVQHEPSPFGEGVAVVFVRDCGEPAVFATQVALIGQADAGSRDRNVFFVADANDGAAPQGPGGGPRVRVRWIEGNHLEVAHHPRARRLRAETEHGDVRITYVPLP